MAIQVQLRRGTTAENNEFTGAIAELTMDTDTNALRIHDGTTVGGIEVPTSAIADYVVATQLPTEDNNYTWYRLYKSGWVEQGGTQSTNNTTITFPIEMANTNYTVSGPGFTIANNGAQSVTKTTTGFTTSFNTNYSSTNAWVVFGLAATGV